MKVISTKKKLHSIIRKGKPDKVFIADGLYDEFNSLSQELKFNFFRLQNRLTGISEFSILRTTQE